MFEVATLNPNHTLALPKAITQYFQPLDRFIVWWEGDTLHLKRMMSSPLAAVEHAPNEDVLSLDELNDIVHEVRQRRPQGQVE